MASQKFDRRQEFIFRTKEASRLATAIEFYIEKFMSVMHLTLEGSTVETEPGVQSPLSIGNAAADNHWDESNEAHEWASDDGRDDHKQDDLLQFDDHSPTQTDHHQPYPALATPVPSTPFDSVSAVVQGMDH